jgi:hypothetical protein
MYSLFNMYVGFKRKQYGGQPENKQKCNLHAKYLLRYHLSGLEVGRYKELSGCQSILLAIGDFGAY